MRAGEGYEALRDQLHAAWGGMSDLDDMPKAIVHTDVHWGNTVRTPAGDMVLIDWDDAGLGPAIQDVGYFIAHKAVLPTEGVRWAPEMSIAFLQGYEQARPLSDAERQALPHSIVYGAPSYVLAPWENRIFSLNWDRVRAVLDEPEAMRENRPGLAEALSKPLWAAAAGRSAQSSAGGVDVERIDGCAARHKESVPFGSAETEIANRLRRMQNRQKSAVGGMPSNPIRLGPAPPPTAPQIALCVAANAVCHAGRVVGEDSW